MRPSEILLLELSATVYVVLARTRQAVYPYICLRVHAIGAKRLKLVCHMRFACWPDRRQAQLIELQQSTNVQASLDLTHFGYYLSSKV